MTELLLYTFSLRKYVLAGSLDNSDERYIAVLVATTLKSAVAQYNANLTMASAFPNVALDFTRHDNGMDVEDLSSVKLLGYNYHDKAKGNAKTMVANLEIKFTPVVNELIQARTAFMEDFLGEHGLTIKQLCLSACSLPESNVMRVFNNDKNIYMIEDLETRVLKNCHNLSSLELNWMDLQVQGRMQQYKIRLLSTPASQDAN